MTKSVAASLAAASLPILLRLEPELSRHLALRGLKLLRPWWRPPEIPASLAVNCAGLHFSHPVGVAAGFDKDGDFLDALGAIGFSHVEVGTITPRPQPGNRKPRLLRLHASTALVNRMGFNSKGMSHAVRQLRHSSFPGIRGVSIGKNAETPIARSAEDYLACFQSAYSLADYFAINISSPNTSRLRELQTVDGLSGLMVPLQEARVRLAEEHAKLAPIFVKIAPDLDEDQLALLASEFRRLGVDGVIATNTAIVSDEMPGIPSTLRGGGLSGQPLHARSLAVISQLRAELGPGFPIIGVGGITTAEAAMETLQAGANVIQLYTGLVYHGPALLNEIVSSLSRSLA